MTCSHSIAVAQTCPIKGDVKANLDEHVRLTQIAAAEGAQIVVFPELSLTGGAGVAVVTETQQGWRAKAVMLNDT